MSRPEGRIGSRYVRQIVVFVEGDDDKIAFMEWIRALDDDGVVELVIEVAHGCEGVTKNVDAAQYREGPPTFGVVDRDAVICSSEMSKNPAAAMARFLEADDTIFHAENPFCDRVYVLARWEIECCVLSDLECVREELRHGMHATPVGGLGGALLMECERLVPVCAVLLQQRGPPAVSGLNANFALTVDALADVEVELHSHYPATPLALAKYQPQLRAFAAAIAGGSPAYERLLRIVDGKRLLDRVTRRFTALHPGDRARRELLGRLASRQSAARRLDPYVATALQEITRRGRAMLTT